MQAITKKLSVLVRPDKNVRIHTEKQLQEFEKSVLMFGQIRPIVIDENNVILAGNGLYETLVRMGREEAQCYQYTELTENQKKKLMIADNKIFSLGIENLDTLNDFLVDLQGDLEIPGFDEEILKQMVADADEITEKISEYGTLDDAEINQIKEANVRREQREAVAGQPTESSQNSNSDQFVEANNMVETTITGLNGIGHNTAEDQRHIICPKCGETIWL